MFMRVSLYDVSVKLWVVLTTGHIVSHYPSIPCNKPFTTESNYAHAQYKYQPNVKQLGSGQAPCLTGVLSEPKLFEYYTFSEWV